MVDNNVLKAQKYLNAMFGGHPSWKKLNEDGKTGTAVMQGIIRAFQIENGISIALINQSLVLPLSALPAQHHADSPDALVTCESDVSTDCEKPQMQSEEVCSADRRKVHENGTHDNREKASPLVFSA